jgi:hypothetical protein
MASEPAPARLGQPGRHETPVAREYSQRASFAQASPNNSKQKSLDLLGFIRPNRDFSMTYSESK